MLHNNISILENGHLAFSGVDTVSLAIKYGTPLYLTDEAKIRNNCREYKEAVRKYFGEDSLPLYASKALCYKDIYRIINDEGLGTDVVSGGELYTALSVGFPAEKIYFHGNNKTESEIIFALKNNIGGFVVDNLIGQQEIVIKSIGKYINNSKMISGATILGDGEVALILDVNTLV